jgi:hypothetical protein
MSTLTAKFRARREPDKEPRAGHRLGCLLYLFLSVVFAEVVMCCCPRCSMFVLINNIIVSHRFNWAFEHYNLVIIQSN